MEVSAAEAEQMIMSARIAAGWITEEDLAAEAVAEEKTQEEGDETPAESEA
jgi:N utilization substance protein A